MARPTQEQVQRDTAHPVAHRFLIGAEMQAGPNPLSDAEIDELARRHPERWAAIAESLKKAPRGGAS